MRRLLPLLLLLPLGACQPLPHPLTAEMPARNAPLVPPDSADIVVAPVSGAPPALAAALAAALRDAEIPATTLGSGNKASDHLLASAAFRPLATGGTAVTLSWELRAANGRLPGSGSAEGEAADAAWRRGDAAAARALADQAAPAIVRLVEAPAPRAVALAEPLLEVDAVSGAPGDGGQTLSRAMAYALNRAHVPLVEKSGDKKSFVLTGKVELSPAKAGQQRVKVSWILRRPNGAELGRIDQQNDVPAGSLDGPWGDIAFAVANAAAPGVAALIEKVKSAGNGAS
jgi:hypothetical protein